MHTPESTSHWNCGQIDGCCACKQHVCHSKIPHNKAVITSSDGGEAIMFDNECPECLNLKSNI